jgi:hypothetical protein
LVKGRPQAALKVSVFITFVKEEKLGDCQKVNHLIVKIKNKKIRKYE